ncbi:restriction endonuclease [Nocardia ignorata]|uniref:restriction endonuclease n=1 Tax=Nocardia ignorata TaxID=145285 RepID=UPI000A041AF1
MCRRVVTANGADGSIDVLSSSALAQVKWRGGAVSRPDVQQFFGTRGNDCGKALLYFAASDYSQPAVGIAAACRDIATTTTCIDVTPATRQAAIARHRRRGETEADRSGRVKPVE